MPVRSIDEVKCIVCDTQVQGTRQLTLMFTHCEVPPGMTAAGVPQLSMDQLSTLCQHLAGVRTDAARQRQATTESANVQRALLDLDQLRNVLGIQAAVRSVHQTRQDAWRATEQVAPKEKLMRRKLQGRSNWGDWEQSKIKQLEQYREAQEMFGEPVPAPDGASVFHFVWTYVIKTDGTKKS